jgi:hypothetical protein
VYLRLTLAAIVLLALAGTHWKAYTAGQGAVRAAYQAEALKAEKAARQREQALQQNVEDLDRELQKQKARNGNLDRAHAERLREYQAALGRATQDASPTRGAPDPFARIASECGAALQALDQHDRELARIAEGLQRYTTEVCVNNER